MSKIPTITDIATIAGVSVSTVSRALQDHPRIGEKTRTKIKKLANELGYVPDRRAAGLKSDRTGVIALLCLLNCGGSSSDEPLDSFQMEIISAITKTLGNAGYDTLLVNRDEDNNCYNDGCVKNADYYLGRQADGYILLPPYSLSRDLIKKLVTVEAPFVSWHQNLDGLEYPIVDVDNYHGGKIAAEYLISQGRTRIGFVTGKGYGKEYDQRYQGFLDGLVSAGIDFDQQYYFEGYLTYRSGKDAYKYFSSLPVMPDGIFAVLDSMALGVIDSVQKVGSITIPDDLSIVGYNNISLSNFFSIPLTTIDQKIEEVGVLMALKVVSILQNRDEAKKSIILPELIKRKS